MSALLRSTANGGTLALAELANQGGDGGYAIGRGRHLDGYGLANSTMAPTPSLSTPRSSCVAEKT